MKIEMNELFGSLLPLISDKDIFEISIESHYEVYAHRKSGWSKEHVFESKDELLRLVRSLVSFFDIDKKEVMFSRYISEVLSVSVTMPPVAFKGPSLRFLKLARKAYDLEDYINWKAIDLGGKKILEELVSSPNGIICAGDSGSGKTTLFNVLLNSLPKNLSITSIEPFPDLAFQRERVCRLMPRGTSETEIKEVLEAASRMGGDYITLGWMSEQWVSPYIDLLKNNSCGICVAGGSSAQNVIERILRQAVVSSYGYNLEEAAINLVEVFKYIIFQEKDKVSGKRYISSINKLEFNSGEIELKNVYTQVLIDE